MAHESLATDINLIADFLAREEVKDLQTCKKVDCIVICVSAVLTQAQNLFHALEQRPNLTRTVVVVGGKGHSTQHVYDAVARHEQYHTSAEEITGLPESRVMETILQRHFDLARITSQGCRILFEDQSTNCGSNAIETRKVLHNAGVPIPATCIIVQDPTMLLRTIASFDKAYIDVSPRPRSVGCPIFVPRVHAIGNELRYDIPSVPEAELWPIQRFYELLAGEIPRLRDDANGYGPRGKDFITHVDVPEDVEKALVKINEATGATR